jgi:hypothetical protein
MERSTRAKEAAALEEAKCRFEQWRQSRPKGRSRIPAELWQTAVDLIGPHSVNEVARGLKLNYRDLKMRHEAQPSPAGLQESPPIPRFVELPLSPPASRVSDCVLEVEGREGRNLKVTVRHEGSGLDVLVLAKGLWELTS